MESGLRRDNKNEKREKKERKGKTHSKGERKKGERKKGERRKEERRIRDSIRREKTKGEDVPPRVRVFLHLHCWIQLRGSYVCFIFVRFSTTTTGLWYFFLKSSLWVFWLRN